MKRNLYQVRYTNKDGLVRVGHVRGLDEREAVVKAKRFVITGGRVVSVLNTYA